MDEGQRLKFLQDMGVDVFLDSSSNKVVYVSAKELSASVKEMLATGIPPSRVEFRIGPRVLTLAALPKLILEAAGGQVIKLLGYEYGAVRFAVVGADEGADFSKARDMVAKDAYVQVLEVIAEDQGGKVLYRWDRKAEEAISKALAGKVYGDHVIDAIDVGLITKAIYSADTVEAFLEAIGGA